MNTTHSATAGGGANPQGTSSSTPPGSNGPPVPGPPITVPLPAAQGAEVEDLGGETVDAPSVGTEKAIDPARRDNLARYVLLGLAIITVIAIGGFIALAALDRNDAANVLYDGALKALPPLATLVIGFYFK